MARTVKKSADSIWRAVNAALACLALAAVLLAAMPVSAVEPTVHECDRLAAHPEDPERMADGVYFTHIDTESAIAACEAAKQGNADGLRLLADLYARGEVVPEDRQKADVTEDIRSLRQAAEGGNRKAQRALAIIYRDGLGVTRDLEEALKWARLAADAGDPEGQVILGLLHDSAQNLDPDDWLEDNAAVAVHWYRQAAEQGDADGQYRLGIMYWVGKGVENDDGTAFGLLRRAADQGHRSAMHFLGSRLVFAFDDGRERLALFGFDSKEQALSRLRSHAEADNDWAQFVLGHVYQHGYGVPQDTVEARAWYRRARALGNSKASDRLREIPFAKGFWAYKHGNYETALRELHPLAERVDPDAQHTLGMMYVDGAGVPQDDVLAYIWLSLAAVQGETASQDALESLTEKMIPARIEEARRLVREFAPRKQRE